MSYREIIFYVVLVMGALALLHLYWPSRSSRKSSIPSPAAPQNLVEQLLEGSALSSDERRVWLDQLLVQQQEEDKKE
jgi:hypothetical protein